MVAGKVDEPRTRASQRILSSTPQSKQTSNTSFQTSRAEGEGQKRRTHFFSESVPLLLLSHSFLSKGSSTPGLGDANMPSLPSLSLPSPPLPDEPPPSLPLTPPSSPTSPASRSLPSLSPPTTYTDFDLDFTPISTPYETSSDPPPADEPPETDELESLQGLSITDRWMAENPREMELAALESNLSTHRKALYASLQAPVTACVPLERSRRDAEGADAPFFLARAERRWTFWQSCPRARALGLVVRRWKEL